MTWLDALTLDDEKRSRQDVPFHREMILAPKIVVQSELADKPEQRRFLI